DAEVLALAERERVDPAVLAHDAPRRVYDGPRAQALPGALFDEGVVAPGRDETKLLALPLVRAGELQRARFVADRALLGVTERKAQLAELGLTHPVQKVALVLARVPRPQELDTTLPLVEPRVVTRRDALGAEPLGQGEELGELDASIAAHARARRSPGQVVFDERLDDGLGEELASIEGVMGDAELVRDAPGVVQVFRRAAARSNAAVVRVVPEVQRHADHVVARPREARRGHGRVDPAAHGNQHATSHPAIFSVDFGPAPDRKAVADHGFGAA